MAGVDSNQVRLTRYFYSRTERPDDVLTMQLSLGAKLVDSMVPGRIKPHQRDALVCLVSDVIVGLAQSPSSSFEDSFLSLCLKKGMMQIVAAEFHNFCFVGGKFNSKAWHKRKAEHHLFMTGQMLFGSN